MQSISLKRYMGLSALKVVDAEHAKIDCVSAL